MRQVVGWVCFLLGAVLVWQQGAEAKDPGSAPSGVASAETMRVPMKNSRGETLGTLEFLQTSSGLLIRGDLRNVRPGAHAVHLHEVGTCTAPGFESAGGHFNPTHREHGVLNPRGMHLGDMANLNVPESGQVTLEVLKTDVRLKRGNGNLLDANGSSLVIHAGKDDHAADPAGNAGDRIACGELNSVAR